MKQIIAIAILLTFGTGLNAQTEKDTTWKSGTSGTITFSQVSLSNWAAGGENSYSADGRFKFFTNYAKSKTRWSNMLDLAYGLVKIMDDDTKKSNDQIDFESKLGYDASRKWDYSLMFNFRTQFTEGYDFEQEPKEIISDFMAPAYITLSLGMDYRPTDHLSILLSPMSGRTTIVNNQDLADEGAFGVSPGNNTLHEYGGLAKIKFDREVLKNINFETKAVFFSAYNNNPKNVDVNWEVLLDMKINKYFTTSLRTHLIYDDDTKIVDSDGIAKPMVQFKEAFGFGISYKFPEPAE